MKKTIIVTSIIAFAAVIVTVLYFLNQNGYFKKKEMIITTSQIVDETTILRTTKKSRIMIEIKGEVMYPGLYSFDQEIVRVIDVVMMAGGYTTKADKDNTIKMEYVYDNSTIIIGDNIQRNSYIITGLEKTGKININKATLKELMEIPGIGEARANAIIEYRTKNGSFKSVEDIKKVNGFGDNLFDSIKDYISIDDAGVIYTNENDDTLDLYIEIKGEVMNPGIYHFTESSVRVIDVVIKAGGYTSQADTGSTIELQYVKNNSTIVISSKSDGTSYILEDGKVEESKVININTATKEELMSLNGIGESLANEIITYRKKNGIFSSIEEIMNVPGIGEKIFAKIKDFIRV